MASTHLAVSTGAHTAAFRSLHRRSLIYSRLRISQFTNTFPLLALFASQSMAQRALLRRGPSLCTFPEWMASAATRMRLSQTCLCTMTSTDSKYLRYVKRNYSGLCLAAHRASYLVGGSIESCTDFAHHCQGPRRLRRACTAHRRELRRSSCCLHRNTPRCQTKDIRAFAGEPCHFI